METLEILADPAAIAEIRRAESQMRRPGARRSRRAQRARTSSRVSHPTTYTVVLSPAAKRAVERELPEAVAVAVIEFLYGPLAADPHQVGQPLRSELAGYWSVRRGQFSVVYSIHDEVLVRVVSTAHRADVHD